GGRAARLIWTPGRRPAPPSTPSGNGSVQEAVQSRVGAAGANELAMGPLLDELPLIEHEDPMGGPQRAQAVGDEKHRPAPADLGEIRLDDGLGLVVQGA